LVVVEVVAVAMVAMVVLEAARLEYLLLVALQHLDRVAMAVMDQPQMILAQVAAVQAQWALMHLETMAATVVLVQHLQLLDHL
jgi:hypothetical protein